MDRRNFHRKPQHVSHFVNNDTFAVCGMSGKSDPTEKMLSMRYFLTPETFQSGLPLKYERCLCHERCEFQRSKKWTDRIAIATTAALYICNSAGRISAKFPWFGMKSIKFAFDKDNSGMLTVESVSGSFKGLFKDSGEFAISIASYVKSLLPEQDFRCIFPADTKFRETETWSDQTVQLYISQCYAIDKMPDADLVALLRSLQKTYKGIKIDKARLKSDQHVSALLAIVPYAKYVTRLELCGKGVGDAWARAGDIVRMNQNIRELTMSAIKKKKETFPMFVSGLRESNVSCLKLRETQIEESMLTEFMMNVGPRLSDVEFQKVTMKKGSFSSLFATKCIEPAMGTFVRRINKLSFIRIPIETRRVSAFVKLLEDGQLTRMSLIECDINVTRFMKEVGMFSPDNENIKIAQLDLSGNRCSAAYTGDYNVPSSLSFLKLARIKWEGESLFNVLARQKYRSTQITVDLSQAVVDSKQMAQVVNQLPDEPPHEGIRGFLWNGNALSKSLLGYLAKLKYLQVLSISHCTCSGRETVEDVVAGVCGILRVIHLKKLYIAGSLKRLKDKAMTPFYVVLREHSTMAELDVSGNNIGDNGLNQLMNIVKDSGTHIEVLEFDDCNATMAGMCNFLRQISTLHWLHGIVRPRREFVRLSEKTPKRAPELREAWELVAKRKADTERPGGLDYTETDNVVTDITDITSSAIITQQPLEVTWDVNFDNLRGGSFDVSEWEAMRNAYAYVAISGAGALYPREDIDNLVDFAFG